jgi:hypothetical protein
MVLTVIVVAALWTLVSTIVVGCCISAAEGDGRGWSGVTATTRRSRVGSGAGLPRHAA